MLFRSCVALLTKFHANVFKEELIRCLRIILQTNRVQLVLKPHPRGRGEAHVLKKLLSSDVEIATGHVIEAVESADFILALPSSAIYDALLLKKAVLFPSFVTSSVLHPDILKYVRDLRCPDDLYAAVDAIVNAKAAVQLPVQTVPYAHLLAQWQSVLELRSDSVLAKLGQAESNGMIAVGQSSRT